MSQDFDLFYFSPISVKYVQDEPTNIINVHVASGGWVPTGQGAATLLHSKAEKHPQAYQPATQPRASPPQKHTSHWG